MRRHLAVLLLALAPVAAEAETLSATWTPRTTREGEAFRAGLGLQTALRNGGIIRQAGRDNLAALSQSGSGNQGVIVQRGRDHSATLTQTGTGNAYAIIQLGRGATTDVTQTGGEAGITVQLGRPDRGDPAATR